MKQPRGRLLDSRPSMMMTDLTRVDRERLGVQGINSCYHLPSIQSERKTVVSLYTTHHAGHNEVTIHNAAKKYSSRVKRCFARE